MSPFDPVILDHNEAQLDFILEMYSIDHPDQLKFNRPGKDLDGVEQVKAEAAWADVLLGESYMEYMAKRLPSADTLSLLRGARSASTGVVPMGKPK